LPAGERATGEGVAVLGVDLYLLWRAGRLELPGLAGVYERAGHELDRIAHDDAEWCALRRQLVGVLLAAAWQAREAGAAVCVAAGEYARADAAARAEFERLRGAWPGWPEAGAR
jgi:hypothetical protein